MRRTSGHELRRYSIDVTQRDRVRQASRSLDNEHSAEQRAIIHRFILALVYLDLQAVCSTELGSVRVYSSSAAVKMPALDVPVCFTSSAPFRVDSNQLVMYDVIDSHFISRSSVLSTIAEAGGEAKLPDAITLSEFRQWMKAAEAPWGMDATKRFPLLCSVLKVAPDKSSRPARCTSRHSQRTLNLAAI